MNELIARAKAEKRVLLEPEAMQLLAEYELPVPTHSLVTSKEQAVVAAEKTGYPVVLKIVSKDILHKSDVGGVKIGLNSKEAVEKAYEEIMENVREKAKGAVIGGMLVVAHAPQGIECIVGMTKDPQFGPAFLFGLGGIFVELLNDVSFRVLPLTKEDAEDIIKETKGYSLLKGTRGQSPKDVEALVGLILKLARLVEENPEIEEIDINPLLVYEKGILAVDARVIL